MAIQIIVDSASDIQPAEALKLGITCLPLTVTFGDQEYLDAIELSHREFYEKLIECDELPRTSQIPPHNYAEAFAKIRAAGDEAIVIVVSGKLSGTLQSAHIARDGYEDIIHLVDSENVCIGERLLALRAVEMRTQGLSAAEIVEKLNEEKHHIRVLALLDTLEYLKKGGRVSAAAAMAGSLLSIKPVIAIEEGEIKVAGKARGSKQGNNLLRELVQKSGGIDFSRPLCLAYSGLSDNMLQKYITDSAELWQGQTDSLPITTVGCVIGAHAGPGAVAVAFFSK